MYAALRKPCNNPQDGRSLEITARQPEDLCTIPPYTDLVVKVTQRHTTAMLLRSGIRAVQTVRSYRCMQTTCTTPSLWDFAVWTRLHGSPASKRLAGGRVLPAVAFLIRPSPKVVRSTIRAAGVENGKLKGVAAKELRLTYNNSETILFAKSPYYSNLINPLTATPLRGARWNRVSGDFGQVLGP